VRAVFAGKNLAVYVDNMRAVYRGLTLCHMMADTLAELDAMADRIGVGRGWFHDSVAGAHYDIALSQRALAVAAGACEITIKQMAAMAWNLRMNGSMGDPETAIAVMRAGKASGRLHDASTPIR
jgi:Protein of unknown function (DUF4031)